MSNIFDEIFPDLVPDMLDIAGTDAFLVHKVPAEYNPDADLEHDAGSVINLPLKAAPPLDYSMMEEEQQAQAPPSTTAMTIIQGKDLEFEPTNGDTVKFGSDFDDPDLIFAILKTVPIRSGALTAAYILYLGA